jgi:hypothetical protein
VATGVVGGDDDPKCKALGVGAGELAVAAGDDCGDAGEATDGEAATECLQWDVTGTWALRNTGGYNPTITLQQDGTTITGTFTFPADEVVTANVVSADNPITGTLEGDQLVFVAEQEKKDGTTARGEYSGVVTETGLHNGTARDLSVPEGSSIGWGMDGEPSCVREG